MREYSDFIVFFVVVVAFFAGYSIVSHIIKHLKAQRNTTNLNEELWRQQTEPKERKGGREQADDRQGEPTQREEHLKENQETDYWAQQEQSGHREERTEWKWEDATRNRTVKDERYFESVLGLHSGFTPEDLNRRYRELAALYHPDKVVHLGPKLRETANVEMRKINEAYDFFKKR